MNEFIYVSLDHNYRKYINLNIVKKRTSVIITFPLVFLGWSSNEILLGLNQDLKLRLNILIVILLTIFITLLLAGLSFIWIWWIASEGNFGN